MQYIFSFSAHQGKGNTLIYVLASVPTCSIELTRHTGRVLRRFSLAQCSGGPHEFRGVRRSTLLVSAVVGTRYTAAAIAWLLATVASV
jgi:hypothetical protein